MFAKSLGEIQAMLNDIGSLIDSLVKNWTEEADILTANQLKREGRVTLDYLGPNDLQKLKLIASNLPSGSSTKRILDNKIEKIEQCYYFCRLPFNEDRQMEIKRELWRNYEE